MWKMLLLAFAPVALGAVAVMSVKTTPRPLCPINQAFSGEVNCSCPTGYRFRDECTQPDLDHWQCVILKKQLFYCER